jgi:hypothetical protein
MIAAHVPLSKCNTTSTTSLLVAGTYHLLKSSLSNASRMGYWSDGPAGTMLRA